MKTNLNDDERLVKEGAANLQKGLETVGGKLYLTNERLIFEAHKVNIQGGNTVIPLADVKAVTACWTKFLNLVPLMPNSIAVQTANQEHRLVVMGRKGWIAAIDGVRLATTQ